MYDCYTGFKWIARQIRLNEGIKQYIGGGEESYGFLAEDFVRDKDAVSACALLAEICAWAKDQGKTLYDILMEIYVEYGFSKEVTVNVTKPGKSGADEIKAMMDNFRACPPKELGGSKVALVKDHLTCFSSSQKTEPRSLYVLQEQNLRLSSIWKSRVKWLVLSAMQEHALTQKKRLRLSRNLLESDNHFLNII